MGLIYSLTGVMRAPLIRLMGWHDVGSLCLPTVR